MREQISAGVPWESTVGYCRAVRIGNTIAVSGTVAADPAGGVLHPGDAGAQAALVLDRIAAALRELGASVDDVVRTRIFVVDIERDWEAVGEAHGRVFGSLAGGAVPATTLVEVSRLIDPGYLVEIEADAVLSGGGPPDAGPPRDQS